MDSGNQTRRRFFRRAALGGLFAAAAAGIGFKAHAHGGWRHRGFMDEPLDPAKLDERLERMLKHLYVEIDATDAQKEKLGPIVKDAVKELRPLREKMRAARKEAVELLSRDSVDRAAMEKLRAEQMQAADQASRRITRALGDAAEVLTPAQRKQLAERFGRWRGRHG
jgi:Spy/CpxP family protein refolding chaperone